MGRIFHTFGAAHSRLLAAVLVVWVLALAGCGGGGGGGGRSEGTDQEANSATPASYMLRYAIAEDQTLEVDLGEYLDEIADIRSDNDNIHESLDGLTLRIVPEPDYNGLDVITVEDAQGNTVSIHVAVAQVYDPPTVTLEEDDAGAREGVPYTVEVAVADPDLDAALNQDPDSPPDSVTVELVDAPPGMTVTRTDDTRFTLTWDDPAPGTTTVTCEVVDSAGNRETRTFEVQVAARPRTYEVEHVMGEDTSAEIDLGGYLAGIDGIASDNDMIDARAEGAVLIVTPVPDYNGQGTLVLTDGTNTVNLHLRVAQAYDPPVVTSTDPAQAVEGSPYEDEITVHDVDLDPVLNQDPASAGELLDVRLIAAPPGMAVTRTGPDTFLIAWPSPEPGAFDVTYAVADAGGNETTRTFTLQVEALPRTYDVDAVVDEDAALTVDLAPYLDGTVQITGSTNARVSETLTGAQLVVTPGPDYNGTDTVTVTDGRNTVDLHVRVRQVYDPPAVVSEDVTAATEGSPYENTVVVTDADLDPALNQDPGSDPDVLSIVLEQGPPGMTAVKVDERTFRLVLDAPGPGSFVVRYAVVDAGGNRAERTFTLQVEALPRTYDLDLAMDEDTTKTLDLGPYAGGWPLSVVSSTNARIREAVVGTGLVITPDPDYNGADHIVVTNGRDIINVEVAVRQVFDPPVVPDQGDATATEGAPYERLIEVADPDLDAALNQDPDAPGEVLSAVLEQAPQGMDIEKTGDSNFRISWESPVPGQYNIEVAVEDIAGNKGAKSFALNVEALPRTYNITVTMPEDTNKTVDLTQYMQNGEFHIVSSANNRISEAVNGSSIEITPQQDYNGSDRIVLSNGKDTVNLDVIVTQEYDSPVIEELAQQNAEEGTAFEYAFNANDPDLDSALNQDNGAEPDSLTAVLEQAPQGMNIEKTGDNTFRVEWESPVPGQYDITVAVEDIAGNKDTKTFALNVEALPRTYDLTVTMLEDTTKTVDLTPYMQNGEFTVQSSTNNKISETVNGSSIVITPQQDYNGSDKIVLSNGKDTVNLDVVVEQVYDPPVITSSDSTLADEGSTYTNNIFASDVDLLSYLNEDTSSPRDNLEIRLVQAPSGMIATQISSNQFRLTWLNAVLGSHTIEYEITDIGGNTTSRTYTLEVKNLPTNYNLDVSAFEDTQKTVNLGSYLSGTLSISSSTNNNISEVVSGSSVIITPNPDYNGLDTIVVTDGTDTVTLNVVVQQVYDSPAVTSADNVNATVGTAYVNNIDATDVDLISSLNQDPNSPQDYLEIVIDQAPAGMSAVKIDDYNFQLVWDNPQAGQFPVQYSIIDIANNIVQRSFTLNVVDPAAAFTKTIIVKDSMTLNPVANAEVVIDDGSGNVYSGFTNANGEISFEVLPQQYFISVDDDGLEGVIGDFYNYENLPKEMVNDGNPLRLYMIPDIPLQIHTAYPTFLEFLTGTDAGTGDGDRFKEDGETWLYGLLDTGWSWSTYLGEWYPHGGGIWRQVPIKWYMDEGTEQDRANLESFFNQLNNGLGFILYEQTYEPFVVDLETQNGAKIAIGDYANQTGVTGKIYRFPDYVTDRVNLYSWTTMGYSTSSATIYHEIGYRSALGKDDGWQDIDGVIETLHYSDYPFDVDVTNALKAVYYSRAEEGDGFTKFDLCFIRENN